MDNFLLSSHFVRIEFVFLVKHADIMIVWKNGQGNEMAATVMRNSPRIPPCRYVNAPYTNSNINFKQHTATGSTHRQSVCASFIDKENTHEENRSM